MLSTPSAYKHRCTCKQRNSMEEGQQWLDNQTHSSACWHFQSIRRFETSRAKLEGEERALAAQLSKQLKMNDQMRIKG